jgi:hypothetical protein
MRKRLALGFALALGSIAIASAQPYPSRAITLVVPFGAGGPADTIGRIVAEGMREPLGQPVVVENVTGASGTIGVGRVAGAPADGYTSVLGNWATHVLNGAMFALRYDLLADFEPVALVSSDPLLIVARKTMPANDLKEFIAWLKANPATQGTTGAGGISTVGGLFFRKATVPHSSGSSPIAAGSARPCKISTTLISDRETTTRQHQARQTLVLAGMDLAVGAAIGVLLPRTQAEHQPMGNLSDELKEQARELARKLYRRPRRYANAFTTRHSGRRTPRSQIVLGGRP